MVLARGRERRAWDGALCWEPVDSTGQAGGGHHHDRDHARHRGVASRDLAGLGCAGHDGLPDGGHLSCGVKGAGHRLEGGRWWRGNLVARVKVAAIAGHVGRILRWRVKPTNRTRGGTHGPWWEGLKRVGTSKLTVNEVTRSSRNIAKSWSWASVGRGRAKGLPRLVARDGVVVGSAVLVGGH